MTDVVVAERKILDTKKEKSELGEWYYPEAKEVDPDILERRRRVAVCWNRLGLSVQKTAEQLGVSAGTIAKDRKWLLGMWTSIVEADVLELVSRELSKLDSQETELWAAWELSKEDSRETEEERIWNKAAERYEMAVVKIIRAGRIPEVKYMDAILRCQERRSRLLGLDKAVTFDGATFSFATFVESAYNVSREQLSAKPNMLESDIIDVTPIIGEEKGGGENGEFKATCS